MYLKDLIAELEQHDPALVVPRGFDGADWHSDRGDYSDIAFVPKDNVTVGSMLQGARSAFGGTLYGYKGGEYAVTEYTRVCIGEDSSVCGEPMSSMLLRYMIDAAKAPAPAAVREAVAEKISGMRVLLTKIKTNIPDCDESCKCWQWRLHRDMAAMESDLSHLQALAAAKMEERRVPDEKRTFGILARLFNQEVLRHPRHIDHACGKCEGATMVQEGFICAYHEAEAEVGVQSALSPEAGGR